MGRKFIAWELKPSYWQQGVENLRSAERKFKEVGLFDTESQEMEEGA